MNVGRLSPLVAAQAESDENICGEMQVERAQINADSKKGWCMTRPPSFAAALLLEEMNHHQAMIQESRDLALQLQGRLLVL